MIITALDESNQIDLISNNLDPFTLKDAYRVAQEVERLRVGRNEHLVGLKVGFTNKNIWKEYNTNAPIVGALYNTTVNKIDKTFSIKGLSEPRIEPEIIFRIKNTPEPGMNCFELLDCISHVSHGFEIVHSIFKNWQFKTTDTIVAFGLHGALLCGPFNEISDANKSKWFKELTEFDVSLFCNGIEIDRGQASNILEFGPLEALRHILINEEKIGRTITLNEGDLITTGTLTGAFRINKNEKWSTKLFGIELDSIEVEFE